VEQTKHTQAALQQQQWHLPIMKNTARNATQGYAATHPNHERSRLSSNERQGHGLRPEAAWGIGVIKRIRKLCESYQL